MKVWKLRNQIKIFKILLIMSKNSFKIRIQFIFRYKKHFEISVCNTAPLLVPARAYENQVFVAYANRCGQEGGLTYCGLSCVVDPDGKDRLRAGVDEGLLVAEIDMTDIDISREANPYLTDLRPELYTSPVR